jgi:hypothetical protein
VSVVLSFNRGASAPTAQAIHACLRKSSRVSSVAPVAISPSGGRRARRLTLRPSDAGGQPGADATDRLVPDGLAC